MKRYPITSFFILATLLGAGVIALIFWGVIPDELALSSVLSASVAGIVMTAVVEGKAGLKNLFRRVLIWRVGIGYWLFAILFLVPIIVLGAVFNPIFGGDPLSFDSLNLTFNILPMFIVFSIVAGLGQELGWAGFLTPRLQVKHSALVSSLIRAALVLLWHIPLLIFTYYQPYAIADFPYGGWMVQKGVLITVLAMAVLGLPWSIFLTWIFNNTRGSLLLVAVLHGSEIWLATLLPGLAINTTDLNNYWGYGMIMLTAALVIIILAGPKKFSRENERISIQT